MAWYEARGVDTSNDVERPVVYIGEDFVSIDNVWESYAYIDDFTLLVVILIEDSDQWWLNLPRVKG